MARGGRGRLTAGDPDPLGWATTAAYLLAAWRCGVAARGPARGYWIALAVGLAGLGLNKQLDAQTWLIDAVRAIAHAQGWFGMRRGVQAAALGVGAAAGLAGLVAAWRRVPRERGALIAFAGVVVLAGFVGLRAARILHVEMAGWRRGFWLHGIAEPAGLALAIAGAVLARRRAAPAP